MSAEWKHGLCGCFDNCGICIMSFLVPCYQFGKNAEQIGESCFLCGLAFFLPPLDLVFAIRNRGKIRATKGIKGNAIGDIFAWMCCPFCALVQEGQELECEAPQAMARE